MNWVPDTALVTVTMGPRGGAGGGGTGPEVVGTGGEEDALEVDGAVAVKMVEAD